MRKMQFEKFSVGDFIKKDFDIYYVNEIDSQKMIVYLIYVNKFGYKDFNPFNKELYKRFAISFNDNVVFDNMLHNKTNVRIYYSKLENKNISKVNNSYLELLFSDENINVYEDMVSLHPDFFGKKIKVKHKLINNKIVFYTIFNKKSYTLDKHQMVVFQNDIQRIYFGYNKGIKQEHRNVYKVKNNIYVLDDNNQVVLLDKAKISIKEKNFIKDNIEYTYSIGNSDDKFKLQSLNKINDKLFHSLTTIDNQTVKENEYLFLIQHYNNFIPKLNVIRKKLNKDNLFKKGYIFGVYKFKKNAKNANILR